MITKVSVSLAALALGAGLTLGTALAAGRSPNDGGMTDSGGSAGSMQAAPANGPSGDMDAQPGDMDGQDSQSAGMYGQPSGMDAATPAGAGLDQSAIGACAAKFRSYDPASETYLGYDGSRHQCP